MNDFSVDPQPAILKARSIFSSVKLPISQLQALTNMEAEGKSPSWISTDVFKAPQDSTDNIANLVQNAIKHLGNGDEECSDP